MKPSEAKAFVLEQERSLLWGNDNKEKVVHVQCEGCNSIITHRYYCTYNYPNESLCDNCKVSIHKGELFAKLKWIE